MKKYNNPFCFDGDLATKYGDREALLITHFQFWINFNKANGKNFRDGRTWTYQTYQAIAAHFPFWTMRRVRTLLDSLVEQGMLVKGNYNKCGFDKTVWYAFNNEEMFTIAENGNGAAENGLPIPETKPETKPLLRRVNDKEQAPEPQKPTPTKPVHEKSMPFAKAKGVNERTTHRLKSSQQPTFDLLKALDLGATDETLMVLVRIHSVEHLLLSINEYRHYLDRGLEVKRSPIAFIRGILNKLKEKGYETQMVNIQYARQYSNAKQWPLKIALTYCLCESINFEIPASLHHKAFIERLEEGFRRSQGGHDVW